MGSLYERGNVWWLSYYENGKRHRESSGSPRKRDAQRLLKRREGRIAEGKDPGVRFEKITLDELAEDLLTDYAVNGKKSLGRARRSVKRLREFFGNCLAATITTDKIKRYIRARQKTPSRNGGTIVNATINRELAAFKRMFSLAAQAGKFPRGRIPHIPRLQENNARTGYFSHNDFLTIRDELPKSLKVVVSLAYYTGMRKGEILNLLWERVDFDKGVIRLTQEETKNAEARVIPLSWDRELLDSVKAQKALRDDEYPDCPWVCFRRGEKIQAFRRAWKTACNAAGCEGKLFHDFRRTAVRNMVQAGVPEHLAMQISGHKTRSIFDRYNIVDEDDMQDAAQQVGLYLTSAKRKKGKVVAFPAS